jgi:hypothetical protein
MAKREKVKLSLCITNHHAMKTHGKKKKSYKSLVEKFKRTDHLADVGADGRIIVK